MISPAQRSADLKVAAVASRSMDRAEEYAKAHRIPVAYDDYRRLLADESINLVYVALPPSEHARWAIASLEVGKDVLLREAVRDE